MWRVLRLLVGAFVTYKGYKALKRSQGVVKEPALGSVVCHDLIGDLAEHSGIYVGGGQIVHLLGSGKVVKTSAQDFIQPLHTHSAIYVFASQKKTGEKNAKGQAYVTPIGAPKAAQEALKAVGKILNYQIIPGDTTHNCHRFVAQCLKIDPSAWRLEHIKKILHGKFKERGDFYEWDRGK